MLHSILLPQAFPPFFDWYCILWLLSFPKVLEISAWLRSVCIWSEILLCADVTSSSCCVQTFECSASKFLCILIVNVMFVVGSFYHFHLQTLQFEDMFQGNIMSLFFLTWLLVSLSLLQFSYSYRGSSSDDKPGLQSLNENNHKPPHDKFLHSFSVVIIVHAFLIPKI